MANVERMRANAVSVAAAEGRKVPRFVIHHLYPSKTAAVPAIEAIFSVV